MATASDNDRTDGRYEYRVWGRHKKVRRMLKTMASERVVERIDDCYFLFDGVPETNAKVRSDTLKVKRLVGHRRGFERWVSERYRAEGPAPAVLDGLFNDLRLDRSGAGTSFDIEKAVDDLDPDHAAEAVFVTKERTRYRIGGVKAEVSDITIKHTGEVLHSIAIEGADIDELTRLLKKLGLKNVENIAVHVAIDDAR